MSDSDLVMPIHRAIKQGNLSEVICLIADDKSLLHMWTPFGTWLQDAASQGQLNIVRWLVTQGLEVNAYNESNESPPISKAAARGHVDVVRFLIESGAILDTSDSVRNPLFAAIVGGISESHTAVAKLLIYSGIDTSVKYTGKYMTDMDALAFAKEWGRSEIVELLEAQHCE
jgi:ankyrin repeat protein